MNEFNINISKCINKIYYNHNIKQYFLIYGNSTTTHKNHTNIFKNNKIESIGELQKLSTFKETVNLVKSNMARLSELIEYEKFQL